MAGAFEEFAFVAEGVVQARWTIVPEAAVAVVRVGAPGMLARPLISVAPSTVL